MSGKGKVIRSSDFREKFFKKAGNTVQDLKANNIDLEVHHLLSIEGVAKLQQSDKDILIHSGYDINHMNNLAAYPKELKDACFLQSPIHRSGHPKKYYDAINDLVHATITLNKKFCDGKKDEASKLIKDMDELSEFFLMNIQAYYKRTNTSQAYSTSAQKMFNMDAFCLVKDDIYNRLQPGNPQYTGCMGKDTFPSLRATANSSNQICTTETHKQEAKYQSLTTPYEATIGGQ